MFIIIYYIIFIVLLNLEEVNAEWLKTEGPHHIKTIADHYNVFQDLFGDAYFNPRVPLKVIFQTKNEYLPVYYGNTIKPADAKEKPIINYESNENNLWTLILTNPDGHLTKQNSEYVHWFV